MASVKPRTWKKPDGSTGRGYEVRYIDPETGKRPSKTFAMKKDADAYKRKVEREIEDGTHVSKELALTVKDVCDRYATAARSRKQRGEIGGLRVVAIDTMIYKHIVPNIGGKVFKDLTVADIDGLYDTLTKTLSPFFARQIIGNLGTMEKYAKRQGFLRSSPVASALAGIRSVPAPRIEEFNAEQVTKLLSHALTRGGARPRFAAFMACGIHLAACCGLRAGEIFGLRRESIDFAGKRLRIRYNLTQDKVLKGPKTVAGNRDIPLPDHLSEMLRRWLETYFVPNPADHVFTTCRGGPHSHDNFRYGWHIILDECGLKSDGDVFHFHALRHFAGSWWLENGMPIQDVALQLGHASASTTLEIYAHTVSKSGDRQAAMTKMGSRLLLSHDAPVTHHVATC